MTYLQSTNAFGVTEGMKWTTFGAGGNSCREGIEGGVEWVIGAGDRGERRNGKEQRKDRSAEQSRPVVSTQPNRKKKLSRASA